MHNITEQFISKLNSKNTKTAYRKDLEQFQTFVKKDLLKCVYSDFTSFKDQLSNQGALPTSINRKFSTLKSFYRWAMKLSIVDKNYAELVDLPKHTIKNSTQALSDEETITLINTPDVNTFYGNTHRMLMILLFNLAFRRAEVVGLRFSDIVNDSGTTIIKFKAKGGKFRALPLNTNVLSELQRYKIAYEKLTGNVLGPNDFILQTTPNKNKKAMDPRSVYRIISEYAAATNINRVIGAHSCRATTISHLLDTKKVPIRDVADFAGHASTNTTLGYDKKRKGHLDSAAFQVGLANVV